MSVTTENFTLAIEHLRQDMRERDERQTAAITALAAKNEQWQGEVRDEFNEVKNRLTIIETQTATKEDDKKSEGKQISKWIGWVLAAGLLVVDWFRK